MHLTRLATEDFRRIAIVKPSALGDIVQTLPVIPHLRRRYPEAVISWVVASQFRDLLSNYPGIDQVICFNRKGNWRDWKRLLGELRAARFDLVLDLQGLLRTGVMTWATGARVRVGLQTSRELSHLACHALIPETSKDVPAWQRMEPILRSLGCPPDAVDGHYSRQFYHSCGGAGSQIKLPLSAGADSDCSGQKLTRIGFQLGAMWVTKRWPVEKFAQLAVLCLSQPATQIVLMGSPAEEELAGRFVEQLMAMKPALQVDQLVNLCGKTKLSELAGELSQLSVLVTNDSGPMHLADVLQVPIVGIFTCTDPVRSGPKPSELHRLISATTECRGSYCKTCPYAGPKHLACFETIQPEMVYAKVLEVVSQKKDDR